MKVKGDVGREGRILILEEGPRMKKRGRTGSRRMGGSFKWQTERICSKDLGEKSIGDKVLRKGGLEQRD